MKKKHLITGIISAAILGICSLPFLPITGFEYIESYEEIIKIGSYEIEAYVVLNDKFEDGKMDVSGFFRYPMSQIENDGCLLEVSVNLEGYIPKKYPTRVINTKYQKNFSPQNRTCNSLDDSCQTYKYLSNETRRLHLSLYDQPLVSQIYTFELKPKSDKAQGICNAIETFEHKVRYKRATPFDVAMSV